jgi:hypothetical protein
VVKAEGKSESIIERARSVHVVQWADAENENQGLISLEQDGSLLIMPRDDFYAGSLTPDEANALADAILKLRGPRKDAGKAT